MATERETVMVPLPIGGMFNTSSTTTATLDVATIPDGYASSVQNFLHRAGRWATRPQWATVTSALSVALYLSRWEDSTAGTKNVLWRDAGATIKLYATDAASNSFADTTASYTDDGGPSDAVTYRGRLFFNGTHIYSYNGGTTVTTDALGGETIYADTLATFIDRIFLGRVHVSIANQLTVAQSYDPTTSWVGNNVTAEKITNGTTITGRITPTNTTTASWYLKDIYTVAAATKDTFARYWCDLRNTSAIYNVPVKVEVYYSQIWVSGATYAVGAIRVPTVATGNGFRYRVTSITTGVAAAGEPAWPLTVGTTIVDGGVTWICDGTDAAGSTEGGTGGLTIYNTSFAPNFTRTPVLARVGANPQSTKLGLRVVYGNSSNATYTLTSLEVSLRDGKTDGTLGKTNYGQQLTVGRFAYDFFNQESTATATVTHDDRVYWTETSNPDDIRGSNYQLLQEEPGPIVAVRAIAGRLVVFKKRGMWVFSGTADPDLPLRLEKFYATVGTWNTRSLDAFENTLYFIGQNEVYAWTVGQDPIPLAGDPAREFLFPRPSINFNYLAVDHANREIWTSTSETSTYQLDIYNLNAKAWTRASQPSEVIPSNGPSVPFYSLTTANMLVYYFNSSGVSPASHCVWSLSGVTLNDPSSPFTATWTPRGVRAPDGKQLFVRQLWMRVTGVYASTDRLEMQIAYSVGSALVAKDITFTLPPPSAQTTAVEFPIPVFQTGDGFLFTFTYRPQVSNGGFSVAALTAECEIVSMGVPPAVPGVVSGSL